MTPTSFSYDFDLSAPQGKANEPELFALDELKEFQLPDGSTLALNPRNGREMTLPADVMNAMYYCRSFRTLDEHVDELMEGSDGSNDRRRAISSTVKAVHDGGLTISAKSVCERLTSDQAGSSLQEPPVVVIITCDRPEALKRLLDSFPRREQPEIKHCYIVDDSRSAENQAENLKNTSAFNELSTFKVDYFGEREANDLVQELIRRLPDSERQIRFLVCRKQWKDHFTAGLARNYSLLLSVGSPLVVFDDDTMFGSCEPPISGSGIEFSNRPKQACFYGPEDGNSEIKPAQTADTVKNHMRCLGLFVPEALDVLGPEPLRQNSLRHADAGLAASLGPRSQVLVTECGTLGDPGTVTNRWLAALPVESRDRLMNDDSQLEKAFRYRDCWLGVDRPTFQPRANMSQVTGFDNRNSLPPYFPTRRGEDDCFGRTLKFVFPQSVCLNYTWAVRHSPIPQRHWPADTNRAFGAARFPGNLTNRIISQTSCHAEDPDLRLKFLAGSFRDFADSSRSFITNLHIEDWLGYKSYEQGELHKALEQSKDATPLWTDFIRQSIQNIQNASIEPISKSSADSDLVGTWKSNWDGFGRALDAWPDIRREARDIINNL